MRRSLIGRLSVRRDEAGFTLVEVLVASALMAVLGGILTLAFAATVKAQKYGQDESAGLGDVRAVIEQLGRDVRSARAVVCDKAASDQTCQSHLQLWIDYNSDYQLEADTEQVTWQLVKAADGQHYQVIRTVNGHTRIVARSLIVQVAFSYDIAPTQDETSPTQQVTTFMTYDTLIGLGTQKRNLTFTERLRNVV